MFAALMMTATVVVVTSPLTLTLLALFGPPTTRRPTWKARHAPHPHDPRP